MLNHVHMLTGNTVKFEIAKDVFLKNDIPLFQLKIEPCEIQSMSTRDVALFAAMSASQEQQVPVFKSDVGIYFVGLSGFPGTFVRHIHQAFTANRWLKILEDVEDTTVVIEETIALAFPDGTSKSWTDQLNGYFIRTPQGTGEGLDQILIHHGMNKPMGCYSPEERLEHWKQTTRKPYEQVALYIKNRRLN